MNVDVVLPCANILGESPLWCPRRARLFWVDIRAPALYACNADGSGRAAWPMPETIGSFAFTADDTVVVALKAGFHSFEPATGRLTTIAEPEHERPQHRFNEGKCDPRGRFWAGSMNDIVREPTGALYRLDPDHACHRLRTGIAVPNSLAWTPDGRQVYFADTQTQQIMRHAFDLDAGTFGPGQVFVDLHQRGGRPDGSTVDADGCLWNAEVATGRVVRYAPDGREILALAMPVTRPTSLAFGDSDLRTLYITSSSYKLGPEELAAQPHAGALFAVRTEVAGLPPALYGG